jgi:hypothetical protein
MEVEAFARAPYPAAGDVAIDGHRLSAVPGRAELVEQRYDLPCSSLERLYPSSIMDRSSCVGQTVGDPTSPLAQPPNDPAAVIIVIDDSGTLIKSPARP